MTDLVQEKPTAEEIARHYSAELDTVKAELNTLKNPSVEGAA